MSYETAKRVGVMTVVIITFIVTVLLFNLALMSYVQGQPVTLHFDKYGEHGLELGVLALIIGTFPFVLVYLDRKLR